MIDPSHSLINLRGVVKAYPAPEPLRIASFSAGATDRFVLSGFDASAAEVFIYLITGAALPDEGEVVVSGRNTREIATDTEWLASLDQFGIVTHRAVLLDGMSVAANLALPLTLSIDPMPADVRARVERDAADVEVSTAELDGRAEALSEESRLRLHLARAAATGPALVMLEHPTSRLMNADASRRFGQILQRLSTTRGFGWIALSDDGEFAAASGGVHLRLIPATGELLPGLKTRRSIWRWF